MRRSARAAVSTRVRAVLAVGVLLGLLSVSARAQWTDGATAVATFSTGSIDLRLGAGELDGSPPETAALTLDDMVPGSQVSATLPVSNVGTVPLTYSMTTAASGESAASLLVSVYAGGACPATGTPTGTPVLVGAPLASATFGGRALTGSTGGAPAETLCFQITLSTSAPSSLQGTTTTATFTFTGVST